MSMSHPMVDLSFAGRLNAFKARVDNAIDTCADALEGAINVEHKKVGGLHFVKVGRLSASFSIKRKPEVAKPVDAFEPTCCVSLDDRIARFVR